MKRYRNLSGISGVIAYQCDDEAIRIRFAGSEQVYEYSHASAGRGHVEEMKRLAQAGRGLGGYVSRHVSERYVR